jgi:hypothetical protein
LCRLFVVILRHLRDQSAYVFLVTVHKISNGTWWYAAVSTFSLFIINYSNA